MENELFKESRIPKLYLQISLPVVLGMVVSLVYNLADTYFVAATNNTDLVAGVSLGGPVFTMLMALGNIFGQGGSSLVSRLLGQKQIKDVRAVSAWCFYVSLAVGVVIGAVLIIFYRPFLTLLGANEGTWEYAKDYFLWLSAGSPLVVCSFVHMNLLRTEGMAKESMFATVGGSLVNIVLDPVFIFGLGMGAAGAAIASVLGYFFNVVFCFVVVKKKSSCFSVAVREVPISADNTRQILAVGISAAVTNLMQSASVIFLNQSLLPYGNDKIAAMGISMKVSMVALLILTGFTFGGQPLFGYFYGSGESRRLKDIIRFAASLIGGLALAFSAVLFILAPRLMPLFMDDAGIVKNGALMLRLQVVTMVFVGLIMLITVLFQSAGQALPAMVLSICRQGLIFWGFLVLLSRIMGYYGVLAAQAAADVVTMVIAACLFGIKLYPKLK